MRLFKAIYTNGVHYLLANSQEEARYLSPSYKENWGFLKSLFEVEEQF